MGNRLFVSVDCENNQIRERIEELQQEIAPLGVHNLEDLEKLHLTLGFIGNVSDRIKYNIKKDLEGIEMNPFSVPVKNVGVFPKLDYIKIIWAGCESGNIVDLHRIVQENLPKEYRSEKEFHPHITISRLKSINKKEKTKLKNIIKKHENKDFGKLKVNGFRLKESILKKDGAVHRTIKKYEFHS